MKIRSFRSFRFKLRMFIMVSAVLSVFSAHILVTVYLVTGCSIWLASLYIFLHSYSWNFLCRKIWQHQAFHDIYQNFAEHELEKMKLENKTVS